MRNNLQKCGRLLLIAALFAASGGHWMVLQSVAWSAMVAQYARGTDLATALEKTFDGRHPCELCKKIAKGHLNEKKPNASTAGSGKLEFCCQPPSTRLSRPGHFWLQLAGDSAAQTRADQPPVPPPRGIAG